MEVFNNSDKSNSAVDSSVWIDLLTVAFLGYVQIRETDRIISHVQLFIQLWLLVLGVVATKEDHPPCDSSPRDWHKVRQ